jgi:hypothetical protein
LHDLLALLSTGHERQRHSRFADNRVVRKGRRKRDLSVDPSSARAIGEHALTNGFEIDAGRKRISSCGIVLKRRNWF